MVLALLAVGAAAAEGPAGHWEGAVELPGTKLDVSVDLSQTGDGWAGTISIPMQNATNIPLENVTVEGDRVSFTISGVPGTPTFEGTVEGASISGDFTQGGQSFPFSLSSGEDPVTAATKALAGIDGVIEQAMADFEMPGLGLGVVVNGQVVLAKGYGVRSLDTGLPVTADTLFAIGSSSKAFTTFVLGTLVDEGLVEWDTPVREYLPEFRMYDEHATAALTVRDLVCHRSGLPRHEATWYNADVSRAELVHRLRYLEPFADLREEYNYQNLMFLTAGYLIERVTGSSWEDNVRQRIFSPLGMDSSNLSVFDSQKTDNFAVPHHELDGKTVVIPFRVIDTIGPAGAINSSINDMTRWLQVQLGGGAVDGKRLIEEATLRDMHTPHMVTGGYPRAGDTSILQAYGMGWFLESFRGEYLVQHGGGIDGFITMVAFLPQRGIGVVTLSNATTSGLSPIVNSLVIDRLLGHTDKDWLGEALAQMKMGKEAQEKAGEDKELTRITGTSPSHPLEDYVGEYSNPGYGVITIGMADGKLNAEFNSMTNVLEHWHYDVFDAPAGDSPLGLNGKFQFRNDFDGNVSELAAPLEPKVSDIVFKRLPDKRLSDPEYLARFTGVYELMGQQITVVVRGDSLYLEATGRPSQKLIPVHNTTFGMKGAESVSVIFVEEAGQVTAMRLVQPGGVYTAQRAE